MAGLQRNAHSRSIITNEAFEIANDASVTDGSSKISKRI